MNLTRVGLDLHYRVTDVTTTGVLSFVNDELDTFTKSYTGIRCWYSNNTNNTEFSSDAKLCNGTDPGGGGSGESMSDGSRAGLILLYTVTTLLSIVGNAFVVIVFARGRRCRTDLRPFLINLSIADLIMALFCLPFSFSTVMLKTWIFSKPMCPIVLFVQLLSVTASVFTNMAIGIDRFMAVTFPLKSRLTSSRSKFVISAIWIVSIGLSSVQLVVGRAVDVPQFGYIECMENWPQGDFRRIYTLFVLFSTYILPLFTLAITYSIVGRILWRRTSPGNADEARDLHQLRSKRKVSR